MQNGPSDPRVLARLGRVRVATLVMAACIANLVSLLLMSWSVLDPTPTPVMVSMSVGQAIGTIALLLYLWAVLLYQVRLRRRRSEAAKPPEA